MTIQYINYRKDDYQGESNKLPSNRMKDILSETDTQTVMTIVARELAVAQSQLTEEAKLMEDLGADSLNVIEIMMALEERLEISIPDEHAENIQTVGDLFELLADLKSSPRT